MNRVSEESFEKALDKIRSLARSNAELKKENKRLLKIERATKLYLEHGEPELADELDALLIAKEK